jgi:hypothetical protein
VKAGGRFSKKAVTPSMQSSERRHSSCARPRRGRPRRRASRAPSAHEALDVPSAMGGPLTSLSAMASAAAASRASGATTAPRARGGSGRGVELLAEERQLQGLGEADEAREHPGAAAVGDEPDAHEALLEVRALRGHAEVAREREVAAEAVGRAVDHRDGGQREPRRARARRPGSGRGGSSRAMKRAGPCGDGVAQVGAGAERAALRPRARWPGARGDGAATPSVSAGARRGRGRCGSRGGRG